MRRLTIPIALLAAVVAAVAIFAPRRIWPPAGASARSFGAPVTFRNLSLVPVVDQSARPTDTYITLDEGLKAKTVKVAESPAGGDVNRLYVTNTGRKPLYLMGGEVVLGGQQDRCLGQDTIVPPGKKGVPITVFCVEHGRWSGEEGFATVAPMVAGMEVRSNAVEGAFRGPVAGAPAGVGYSRGTIVSEKQAKVWDSVARKNQRFGAAPSTGTYRQVLQMAGGTAGKSIEPYVKALSGALPADTHLVGVVAAVDGKVVAADVYGDPTLFRKLWPKLLRAYAADAAETPGSASAKPRPVTAAQAKAFLVKAAAGERAVDRSGATVNTRRESRETLLYQVAPSTPAAGAAKAGKQLHEVYIKK